MKRFLMFLAVCVIASCTSTPTKFGASGGTASPIIPASWTVPAWFIDPTNSSGTASDTNNCTTSATACLTWQEVNVHRWGCGGIPTACPRLRQNTAIEFLSSHVDDTDPVYFNPSVEGGIVTVFGPLGVAQQVASGVLSNVTAKNRSTPQLLLAQSGATAPGQFVVNSTHPSRAWTYKLSSGSIYSMTEPAVAATVPSTTPCGAGVDTWANGDSVIVYQPVAVDLVQIHPVLEHLNGGFTNSGLYIQNLAVLAPSSFDQVAIGFTQFVESYSQRFLAVDGGFTALALNLCNSVEKQGLRNTQTTVPITINAGAAGVGSTNSVEFTSLVNDVIVVCVLFLK